MYTLTPGLIPFFTVCCSTIWCHSPLFTYFDAEPYSFLNALYESNPLTVLEGVAFENNDLIAEVILKDAAAVTPPTTAPAPA